MEIISVLALAIILALLIVCITVANAEADGGPLLIQDTPSPIKDESPKVTETTIGEPKEDAQPKVADTTTAKEEDAKPKVTDAEGGDKAIREEPSDVKTAVTHRHGSHRHHRSSRRREFKADQLQRQRRREHSARHQHHRQLPGASAQADVAGRVRPTHLRKKPSHRKRAAPPVKSTATKSNGSMPTATTTEREALLQRLNSLSQKLSAKESLREMNRAKVPPTVAKQTTYSSDGKMIPPRQQFSVASKKTPSPNKPQRDNACKQQIPSKNSRKLKTATATA